MQKAGARDWMYAMLSRYPFARWNAMIAWTPTVAILVAASAALLGACTQDGSDPTKASLRQHAEKFVPQDAVERIVEPELPWVQISFTVRRPPLEFAVDESRLAQARADGWALCQPTTSEWEGFEDARVTPVRYRQERVFVLYKGGVQITLLGIYDSPSKEVSVRKREGQTETPIQRGYVIARKATEEEALAAAAAHGLSCEMQAQAGGR